MTRSINEIGAGLAPSRPGSPLVLPLTLHIVGIGGTAATGAALHAAALGALVTGCDSHLSRETALILEAAGVKVSDESDLAPASRATLVAVS